MTPEEFDELVEKYKLELVTEEKCDICDNQREVYTSKYSDNIYGLYCNHCNDGRVSIELQSSEANVCPTCGLLVEYDDEDESNYVECDAEMCSQKAHLLCVKDNICSDCNVWVCDEHRTSSELMQCDHCEEYHTSNCIVSFGGDFVDSFGIICNQCFYRDEELIEEIKKPFDSEKQKDILSSIEKNRHYYKEAQENFDLTIMLTHLIRTANPYEILKQILHSGGLEGAITGYFGKINQTESVCFADLTIRGLYRHSKKFSQYGIAFSKEKIFSSGGGPALYIREDLLKSIGLSLPPTLKPFINKIHLESHDFHHEREWRVPGNFSFKIEEISIVYAPTMYHEELKKLFPKIRYMVDLDLMQLI